MITDDELDRILAGDERVVPSSAFTASVLSAVARQAASAAPIPFPWRRALPALAALAVAVIAGPIVDAPAAIVVERPTLDAIAEISVHFDVLASRHTGMIGVALLIAFASTRLSARLVGQFVSPTRISASLGFR
jgi:hypothetical protein